MSDAEPTMTTADILAKAERIYCEFGALMERLRAASADNPAPAAVLVPDAPPVAPLDSDLPNDLIPAAAAAAIARRAKSTIGAWCRANAINGEHGFAIKMGARWFVSRSRLLKHLGVRQAI
jgi:hypothetical protein